MSRRTATGVLSLAALSLSSGTAFAHHAMDYQMPQTFVQGLLSGFGHPIIGPDHLAFILAIGLIGTLFVMPTIIAYSAFAYYVFRGKATELRYD